MQSSATSHIIHFFSCQCSTLHHPLRPIPFSSATFLASLFLMPVQHSAPPTKAYTIFLQHLSFYSLLFSSGAALCNISLFILFSFLCQCRTLHHLQGLYLSLLPRILSSTHFPYFSDDFSFKPVGLFLTFPITFFIYISVLIQ